MFSLAHWVLLAAPFAPLALAVPLSTPSHHVPDRLPYSLAPMIASDHPHGTIHNSYIVVFKDDASSELIEIHFNVVANAHYSDLMLGDSVADGIRHIYDTEFKGYSGQFTPGVLEQIRSMPEVDFVEKDQVVRATEFNVTSIVQKGAPWGLARLSHRERLTFSTFTKYIYEALPGAGVDAYVIDTGINIAHKQFGGRAHWGKTVPRDQPDEDENGHGTHCAGTIASEKYGVAKAAHVYAVKVLGANGSGSMSDVVAGVAWAATAAGNKAAAARAELATTGKTRHKGSVANMSLGGGRSQALEIAVNRAVDGGLHFAVAAGNDNADACKSSPAAAEKVVTVGASTLADERAYFSNYGVCVDVFAPGLNILSTYKGGPNAIATLSGTSMASPHTAGLMAYLLSIYPSIAFNPHISAGLGHPESSNKYSYASIYALNTVVPRWIYALAYATLPRWIVDYLPASKFIAPVDPSGVRVLSPQDLKQAIIELSSPEILADVGKGSPNRLIFNNATA